MDTPIDEGLLKIFHKGGGLFILQPIMFEWPSVAADFVTFQAKWN